MLLFQYEDYDEEDLIKSRRRKDFGKYFSKFV